MLLDVLDDVFLLYLPLEPPERAFDRLAVLYLDLSQNFLPPPSRGEERAPRALRMSVLG